MPQSAPAIQENHSPAGDRLRAARAKRAMTRKQLAAASGTSERYLAHIENGSGNPTIAMLEALAAALDMAPAELLPLGGERSDLRAEAAAVLRRLPETRITEMLKQMRDPEAFDASRGRRLVLVGLRGAGKSSLGTALAERMDLPFLEMTKEIENAYGGEMGLLIELGGQSVLRRYEHEAWQAILARYNSAIIAAPGGIVADAELYDRILASAHCVWLQASPEDHMERVMAQGDFRPMASNRGAMNDLKAILTARADEHARAEASLDTSAQNFDETLNRLESLARSLMD